LVKFEDDGRVLDGEGKRAGRKALPTQEDPFTRGR